MSWGDGAATEILIALVASAVRAAVVAALAGITLALVRRVTAETRLRVWTGVLVVALTMPVLDALVPIWKLPVLSEPPRTMFDRVSPARLTALPIVTETLAGPVATHLPAVLTSPVRKVRSRLPSPAAIVLTLYGIVAVMLGTRAWRGWRDSVRLRARSDVLEDPRLTTRVGSAATAVGLGNYPRIATHPDVRVPCVAGVVRPAVLLPAAWREWTQATLDAVLRHEFAHVARADALVQRLALLHLTFFWFSPLSWWLVRRVVMLGEEASDEAVLAGGTDPVTYVELLMSFASGQRVPMASRVSMASGRGVEQRLHRILQYTAREADRRRGTRTGIALAVLAMMPVGITAASIHPTAAAAAIALMPANLAGPVQAVLARVTPVENAPQTRGGGEPTPEAPASAGAQSPALATSEIRKAVLKVMVFNLLDLPENDLGQAVAAARSELSADAAQARVTNDLPPSYAVMAIAGRLEVLVNVTNDPARLDMALAEVAAAERVAGPAGSAGLYTRMTVDGLIGAVCGNLSMAQFVGTKPELVYFDNGLVRGTLAQADADRTAHACAQRGVGRVAFRWSGAPEWQVISGTARGSTDLRSASVVAFVFDLSTLTPDDLARGRTSVMRTVDTLMQFASVGVQTYHLFAVTELGKAAPLEFTGDRDKTFAALNALVPGLTVLSEDERQQSLQRICAAMPRSRADIDRTLKNDAGFQALQRVGTASDWRVVPTVAYFGPRSLHAVQDLSFDPRCASATASGPASLMFFNSASQEILGSALPSRPVGISLRLAERPADSPVTLSLASTMFDNGSVSLQVRNDSAKAIKSMTLGAQVTPVGSTTPQVFTRAGPAVRITPGASVDLTSAVIDPTSFATLGKRGASAIVGVVAVEFEDGTRWTGELKGGV